MDNPTKCRGALMKRLLIIAVVVLFASPLFAAQTTVNTASDSFETAWDRQQAMNTELYGWTSQDVSPDANPAFNSAHATSGNLAAANAQVTKKWITGLDYVADVTSVVHGGAIYICTSNHTAGSTTEPGVGASWTTVWKFHGIHESDTEPTGCVDGDAWIDTNGTSGQRWYICEEGTYVLQGGSGGTDDQTASEVSITDSGGIITGTNVETALQENRTAIDLNTAKESNSPDATLLARANHTGTQTASTISDFDTEVSNNASVTANTAKVSATAELIEDTVGAMLTGNTETEITVTYQDADGTIDFVVNINGAPDTASYVTVSAEAGLSNETLIGAAIEALSSLNLSGVNLTLHTDWALDTDITYGTLDTNGDVGTSAGQLAIGNHAHTGVYSEEIAAGTTTVNPGSISDGACATVVTDTATGAATTDTIKWSFAADPTSTTGYNPSGDLVYIVDYPTANTVNFKVCNKSGSAVDPGSVDLNWRIDR